MSWAAREINGTAHLPHPALMRACRCWLITWALVAATLGLALTGTTTASAANVSYDAPATAPVDVQPIAAAESEPSGLGDERKGSASPPTATRGTSTTPVARSVATNSGLPALPRSSLPSPAEAADLVRGAIPVGSALKSDAAYRATSFVVDDIASNGSVYRIVGGDGIERTLIQSPGGLNGVAGRFEWIVDDAGNLTHQMFVKGGSINGLPIKP